MLKVLNLNVTFKGHKNDIKILKDISFEINEGECVCILGESGSGKSMATKSIMGLLNNNFEVSGSAVFNGIDLLKANKETLRNIRGKDITMILQNPMICFDSLYNIGYQIKETLKTHTDMTNDEIYEKSIEILEKMRIREPKEVLKKYPHQLSGGMLQRIMIGIAISLNPKILIADEPTTAIDSITQFEIIKEFERLKKEKTTMIFITHDLGVASRLSDRILVMNKGEIVDRLKFDEITTKAKDSYTKELVAQKMKVMESYKKAIGGN